MVKQGRKKDSEEAISFLQSDHIEIKNLYEEFRGSVNREKRAEVGAKILQALEIHADIEEEIFYPAIDVSGGELAKTLVAKSLAEHKAVKNMIDEIRGVDSEDEEFDSKMARLMADVSDHIEEEESDLFPEVKDYLSETDLERLGREMQERKDDVGRSLLEEAEEPYAEE